MNRVVLTRKDGSVIVAKCKGTADVKFSYVSYCFILRHKENEVLKQFYHGPNGILLGSDTCKRIADLEKKYADCLVSDMLGTKVEVFPMDGRTRKARRLPWFSVDMLVC